MSASSEKLYPCPCCGSHTLGKLGHYEICGVCGWEDDPDQSADPECVSGANHESLSFAGKMWQEKTE